jgi:hypothetical protein
MWTSMTSERATVLTSAVVAIAILGAAVTAQPSRTTATERLSRLESDLRYQLELESRIDPAKVKQRTKTLDEVMQAWSKSPHSPSDYKLVSEWLRSAIRSSLPGESGAWPATPSFSVAKAATPAAHEVRKEAAELQTPGANASQPASSNSPAEQGRPNVDLAPASEPEKQVIETKPPQVASAKQNREADKAKPFIVSVSDPVPIGAETLINNAPPANSRVKPQATESPEARHSASPQTDAEASGHVTVERPAPTPDQTAAIYTERPETPGAEPTAVEPVEVNLGELNARIGGYHDGLREVEAHLVASRDRMTMGELAKLVARLEELAGQYEFVQLYFDALTREERHFVITPRSIAATVELVDQRRKRLEAAGVEDHFSTVDETGDSELAQRLKALLELAPERGKACCGGRP